MKILSFRPDLRAQAFDGYRHALPLPRGAFWVFGYGSLMWRPGFAAMCATPARLYGYHRRLCLWSVHYRGTQPRPGLVLGLDRGGSCNGIAFRIAKQQAHTVADYLKQRELIYNAYRPTVTTVHLQGGGAVEALTFVSKRDHPLYARKLTHREKLAVIRRARGNGGANREYVINTAQHLRSLGIECAELGALAELLQPVPRRNRHERRHAV